MTAMPLMIVVLLCLAIAYRYYSAFLAAKVAVLDPNRPTPATTMYDGQNYHPTSKWVLFGHHFAAISGAGPLIGPVLAIQFGYLPGLIWILVGVCLAGAVQDMLVLAASVRHKGRSLAEIARVEISRSAGGVASLTILFVVVIALSGLGVVVVKALGGEEVNLGPGTVIVWPAETEPVIHSTGKREIVEIPAGSKLQYASGASITRGESYFIARPRANPQDETLIDSFGEGQMKLPPGVVQEVKGSSWGTFTIACTVPIALLVGLYMYKLRKGRVLEASLLGALATLAVTVAGAWIPGSPLESYFQLSRGSTIFAICAYGFIASVLPVWLLLCPRDYLSSFLKIGTIGALVVATMVANPTLHAPKVNELFAGGGGPYFSGAIFPFCFICIMCGAISGFHALVASGTTPKMITSEAHIPTIGYGAMLIEGLVAVVALITAASLPQGDFWGINIDLAKVEQYAPALERMGATTDNLAELERQVGGESLRGRTGGAVTLAVGMSSIMTQAAARISSSISLDAMIKYWYHFAIMFEALFILTTIDTGTRIARFLLQEAMGKIYKPLERTDWMPGAILSTAIVTLAWGGLIWTGSIDTIWPMFGIANQMLAIIALAVVTSVMFNAGRGKYAPLTILPMLFVVATTCTAAYEMITGRFLDMWLEGYRLGVQGKMVMAGLNIALIAFIVLAVLYIVCSAAVRWVGPRPAESQA